MPAISTMSSSPTPPNPWPSPPKRRPPSSPPRRKPPIMPPHPNPGREGVGDGEVGEDRLRCGEVGLDGLLGGADGLRGAEYERDPRLPPEVPPPTRASAITVTASEATNSVRIALTIALFRIDALLEPSPSTTPPRSP